MPPMVIVSLCTSGLTPSPFNWPEGFPVILKRNNNIFGSCPVFHIIICQNHINLMYDRPIKWIHLGLQESSLINSDIYSYGFDATIPPPVKQRAWMSDFLDTGREVVCFPVLQRGWNKLASSPGLWEPWLAPLPGLVLLGKGKETRTRHLYTNPTSSITFPR